MVDKLSKQTKYLEKYKKGIMQFDRVIENLPENSYNYSREDGKWTIREIIHHIADAEDIWKTCVKAAVGNSGCDFDLNWYIIDNKWAKPLGYHIRPLNNSIELFKVSRNQIIELLDFYPEAWENYIILKREDLPKGKKFTTGEVIAFQILHLNIHIKQISDTRKKHNI